MIRALTLIILLVVSELSFAETTYVYNITKDRVVIEENASYVRPIASVTKLMTAIVVIQSDAPLDEKLIVGGIPFFRKKATREELLTLMLVKSNNKAAEILAKNHNGGRDKFISEMNIIAKVLNMRDTNFVDPSGIGEYNVSTAKDLSILLFHSYTYDIIKKITSTSVYNIKKAQINNTNKALLQKFDTIEVSKTGTTSPAGKCLVMFVKKGDNEYAVVFLGYKNRHVIEVVADKILSNSL
jgi:D-alanyl-D-alanine endopeptidase (penicillin-binding protein 7)